MQVSSEVPVDRVVEVEKIVEVPVLVEKIVIVEKVKQMPSRGMLPGLASGEAYGVDALEGEAYGVDAYSEAYGVDAYVLPGHGQGGIMRMVHERGRVHAEEQHQHHQNYQQPMYPGSTLKGKPAYSGASMKGKPAYSGASIQSLPPGPMATSAASQTRASGAFW